MSVYGERDRCVFVNNSSWSIHSFTGANTAVGYNFEMSHAVGLTLFQLGSLYGRIV